MSSSSDLYGESDASPPSAYMHMLGEGLDSLDEGSFEGVQQLATVQEG